jgi:hypothetical protein
MDLHLRRQRPRHRLHLPGRAQRSTLAGTRHDAPAAVVEYFKRQRANLNERQLADQAEHLQRYLSFPQDADERECAELEAIAIRQLRAAKEEAA